MYSGSTISFSFNNSLIIAAQFVSLHDSLIFFARNVKALLNTKQHQFIQIRHLNDQPGYDAYIFERVGF